VSEVGPVYNVPLIDTLPLNGGVMRQAMPSRSDLLRAIRSDMRLAAGYEVLLAKHHDMVETLEAIAEAHDAGQGVGAEELCELMTQRAREVLAKIRG
jgi:hypothetical protein